MSCALPAAAVQHRVDGANAPASHLLKTPARDKVLAKRALSRDFHASLWQLRVNGSQVTVASSAPFHFWPRIWINSRLRKCHPHPLTTEASKARCECELRYRLCSVQKTTLAFQSNQNHSSPPNRPHFKGWRAFQSNVFHDALCNPS